MKRIFLIYILFSFAFNANAQTVSFSGSVSDSKTGSELNDVNITFVNLNIGAATNMSGKFFIDGLKPGEHSIRFTHVGYEEKTISITIKQDDLNIDIKLIPVPVRLGVVTVKSVKRDMALKEVSLPMEIVERNKIEKENSITPADLLSGEPGVSISRDGIWATSVNIRGLSKQNIITLVDGNRIETATNVAAGLSLIDLNDVEKIEIIKGGISSIYGSGATGGIVNILTRQAAYNDDFYLNGSVSSSFNSVNDGSYSNLLLNSGDRNWRLKLNGSLRNATDAETPAGTLKDSRFRDQNLSAEFGAQPFDDHEILLNYQLFSAEDVGIPGGSPFPAGASARYPIEEREMYSAEYKVKRISKNFLNLSFKYFHQFIKREVELKPNAAVTVTPKADHNTDGIAVQTNWVFGNHFLILGFDGWQREYKGTRERNIAAQNKIIGDLPIPESTFRSAGVYLNDEVKLLKNRLTLNAGGRFDLINIKNEEAINPNYIIVNGNKNPNPPQNPLASFAASDVDNQSWSLNTGLLFEINRETDIAFNFARSFRSPNLEERFQYIDLAGKTFLGNPKLEPEKGLFFDLGVRRWSKNLSFRANAFLNLFDDLVIDRESIRDSLFIKSNVGEARLYGFDMSFEYNPLQKFVFYGSAAYVIGEDTGNDLDLPEIPPLNGKFGIRFPLVEILNFDLSGSFFSNQEKIAAGEKKTPGYALYDVYLYSNPIDIVYGKIQLFGGVKNLIDKLYRNHLSTNRGFINYEPGRNFFIKAKVSW